MLRSRIIFAAPQVMERAEHLFDVPTEAEWAAELERRDQIERELHQVLKEGRRRRKGRPAPGIDPAVLSRAFLQHQARPTVDVVAVAAAMLDMLR